MTKIQVVKTVDSRHIATNLYMNEARKRKVLFDLTKYARIFLDRNFDMSLKIPITIDGRLSRAGGSFHFYDNANRKEAIQIKMSEKYLTGALQDDEGILAIIDVLSHELVHYALFEQGLPYDDGNPIFENKLSELGIASSGATHKNKRLSKTPNVWYRLVDVYQVGNKTYKYLHAKNNRPNLGVRKEVIVQKYRF